MPKANSIQTNFTSGEISPLLRGRIDTTKYANGAEEILNFIPKVQGGLIRRPGTKHVALAKNASKKCIVVPFEFSSTQTYILEFGDLYMRVFLADAKVNELESTKDITSATESSGQVLVTTSAAHGYSEGDKIVIKGVVGMYEINGEWTIDPTVGATTFYITPTDPTPFHGYEAGGTVQRVHASNTFELVTPYKESELEKLQFAQAGDTLYIVDQHRKPRKIQRLNSYQWTIAEVDFIDGPYMPIDTRGIRMKITGIVDQAVAIAKSGTPFVVGDVNKYLEFQDLGTWRLAKITGYTSNVQVTVNIISGHGSLLNLSPLVPLKFQSASKVPRVPENANLTNQFSAAFSQFYLSPGVTPAMKKRFLELTEGYDPSTDFDFTAAPQVDSDYSGTFRKSDVGKFFRRDSTNGWYKIDTVTHDKRVQTSATAAGANWKDTSTNEIEIKELSRSITASLTSSEDVFDPTHIGRHMRLIFRNRRVSLKIINYVDRKNVGVQLFDDFPTQPFNHQKLLQHGATDLWQFGSWSDNSGWPACVAFHAQRLVFANTKTEPQTIWFSKAGDFEVFSPTEDDSKVFDDSGIAYQVAATKIDRIRWLKSRTVLLLGTSGGAYQVRAATSVQDPITPTNIAIVPAPEYGSAEHTVATGVGTAVLHIQRAGLKVRQLTYSFELDTWVSDDLTVVAEHVLRQGTRGKKTAMQYEPTPLYWVMLENGTLACLTYDREQEILAWSRHQIAGTNAAVESICAAPAPGGLVDYLYMVVKRTVNGSTVRHIERVDDEFTSSSKSDMYYVDAGGTTPGKLTIVNIGGGQYRVDGLTWLINENVSVLADGVALSGTFTVNGSGQITITGTVPTKVAVGLNYTSRIKSLPIEAGSQHGTAQGKMKRLVRLDIRVWNSVGMKFGPKTTDLMTHTFDAGNLATKDYEATGNTGYDPESLYFVVQDTPVALNIVALMPIWGVNE